MSLPSTGVGHSTNTTTTTIYVLRTQPRSTQYLRIPMKAFSVKHIEDLAREWIYNSQF